MKEVVLVDPYGSMTIRMCNKHFLSYKSQMDSAYGGGTAYTFVPTHKRGCEICKRRKKKC